MTNGPGLDTTINFTSGLAAGTYTIELTVNDSGLLQSTATTTRTLAPGVIETPTCGLFTSEIGSTATFTVALATVPEFAVDIEITSLDDKEGLVRIPSGAASSSLTLRFTADISALTPQTVVVAGQPDDGGTEPSVTDYAEQVGPVSSSYAAYAAIDPDDVVVTNLDFP